jgi:MFS family permease
MSEKAIQKRQFWVILIIVFLGFVGISMPYLIFPALFFNPEYSIVPSVWGDANRAIFLGITLAAYPLGQFLGSPILGSLSDDYGRKPLLAGSLLIAGLCNLLSGWSIAWQHLGLLILSRFLTGLMEGNIAIARAMASDLKLLSKHETFGKINAVASIAFLIGPLLGGLMTDKSLFEELTTSTPFYTIFVLFTTLAGLAALVLKKTSTIPSKEIRSFWERINLIKRLSSLFTNKRLQFLMIISTCLTLAVDIFYEFGPVYLTMKWAFVPSDLILYNGGLCVGLALGNGWLPQWISKFTSNQRLMILGSIAGFALFLIGMILTNSTVLMLLLFSISGLFVGLAVTLITVKISNSVGDAVQGEVMGVQLSLRVLGDGIICLLGGFLLLLSSKIILLFAALLTAGTFVYYSKSST